MVIPRQIEMIAFRTFYGCKQLQQVTLPPELKIIGREAFVGCCFQSLALPEGLVTIGDSAFLKCKFLESIHIPESVRRIEKWAFHGCPRLKKVVLLHDPEVMGDWLFNRGNTVVHCKRNSKVDDYCKEFQYKTEYVD